MALIEGAVFLVAPQMTVFLLGGWLGFDLGKTEDELLPASVLFAALGLLSSVLGAAFARKLNHGSRSSR